MKSTGLKSSPCIKPFPVQMFNLYFVNFLSNGTSFPKMKLAANSALYRGVLYKEQEPWTSATCRGNRRHRRFSPAKKFIDLVLQNPVEAVFLISQIGGPQ